MTPETIVGVTALCLSITGSAWWLGRELGEIKSRLTIIDRHMTASARKAEHLDDRVDDHAERIVRLETSYGA